MSDELMTITFGLLKEGFSKVMPCLNWKPQESDVGIFMIRTEKQLSNFDKIIVQKEGELIWSSNIRVAPDKNLEIPFRTTDDNIYISAKAIREVDVPFGDKIYDVILLSQEREIGRGVLMIEETRSQNNVENSQETEDSLYDMEDINSIGEVSADIDLDYDMESEIPDSPGLYDVQNQKTIEPFKPTQDIPQFAPSVFGQQPEETKPVSAFGLDSGTDSEYMPTEQYELSGLSEQVEVTIENHPNDINNTNNTDRECTDSKAIKTKLIEILSSFAPVSISLKCSDSVDVSSKDYSNMDVVIEKIDGSYITVLNNFFGRKNYLLHNEEKSINWDGSFNEYMNRVNSMLVKKYSLEDEDLQSLKTLVICDEEGLNIGHSSENITVASRKTIIDSISRKYNQIVDLKEDCSIYVESEGKSLFMNFEQKRIDDALDFLENEPTLLLGTSANKSIEDRLLNNLNGNKEVKLSNLAWEVCIRG